MTKMLAKLTLMVAALFSTAQAADDFNGLFREAQTKLAIYRETYVSAHQMCPNPRTQTALEHAFAPWNLQNDATYGSAFKKISSAISALNRGSFERVCQAFGVLAADLTKAIHLMESKMPALLEQRQIIKNAFEAQMRQDAEQRAWLYENALERAHSGLDHWRSSKQ